MADAATDRPALPPIPTDVAADALAHFRRPFTPGAVKWKVQITGPKNQKEKTWATIVGYIDARLVTARLNAVVAGEWEEAPVERMGNNILRYKLTVLGQTHTDIGQGQGKGEGMLAKATDSDALKRVAVRFGIGEYLYAMPPFSLYVTPEGEVRDDKPTLARMKDGRAGYLKEAHEAWLREEYQRWLDDEGIAQFGEPLDHGDARTGSVGGLDEVLPGTEEDDTPIELRPAALDDDKAKALRERAAAAYAELAAINPDRLTDDRFKQLLEGAAHSHAELERVASQIETLRETEAQIAARVEKLTELLGKTKAKPLIDAALRRGSQEERIAALDKAIGEAQEQEGKPGADAS